MATNGMTINSLNPLSALTADDKIPVWDTGASGEPTKEITAQNMANSVKSLASLPNTTEMNTAIEQSTATGGTNYFQSPDGTQICYLYIRDFTFQPNTTTTKEYTFPKPFLEIPAISMSVRTTIPNQLIASPYNTSGTGFTLEGVSTFSVAQNPWVAVIAIGRWK